MGAPRPPALVSAAAGQTPDDAEREETESDHEQDPVVRHLEHSHEDDAETGERDQRARHHQAETRLRAHDQMTASRRSRSMSSTE
jgi:hypothetical protein